MQRRGGVILHTRDGGKSWTAQLGDPESSERAYRDLRFVDATHDWAIQRTGGPAKRCGPPPDKAGRSSALSSDISATDTFASDSEGYYRVVPVDEPVAKGLPGPVMPSRAPKDR